MASPSFQQFFNAGVPVKANMEEAGINVDLQTPDWPTLIAAPRPTDQWHLLITSWGIIPDPSMFAQNYHSQSGDWGWLPTPRDGPLPGRDEHIRSLQRAAWPPLTTCSVSSMSR